MYESPQYFLPSFKSISLLVQEKKIETDFQDGSHLGFRIGANLAIFYLLITPMPQTKFRVNLFDGSGRIVENVKG